MEILFLIAGIAIGAVAGLLLTKSKTAALTTRIEMTESEKVRLNDEKQQAARLADELRQQLSEAKNEQTRQKERADNLEQKLDEQNRRFEQQKAEQAEVQEKMLKAQLNLISEKIATQSENVLKQRSEELSKVNREQLSTILDPLQTNIKLMKEAVEKSEREHTTTMERLDATIKTTLETTQTVGERADKLAQALTNENKTQGNFGEMRLTQLLESMDLEEGLQFETQYTMRDEDGNAVYNENNERLQPDVILHFPDKRDIIIDSKMSFKAYIDYKSATTDEERTVALRAHLDSVKKHVCELSRKNYSKYLSNGRRTPDFVIMYVYQEDALQLALLNDPTLWHEAYKQKVLISGSQNLYAMLRVLEIAWQNVRQIENQQNIIDCANDVIDRVQMFYERFLSVDKKLEETQKAFSDLKTVTADSGRSITTKARELLRYGAQENPKRKKRLPKDEACGELPDQSGDNE